MRPSALTTVSYTHVRISVLVKTQVGQGHLLVVKIRQVYHWIRSKEPCRLNPKEVSSIVQQRDLMTGKRLFLGYIGQIFCCLFEKCISLTFIIYNKNAFQQDAYRPLVDRIPQYPTGVCLPRGRLPRECLPRGVSALRGCVCPEGVCLPRGGCTMGHPSVDRILDTCL